MAAPIAVTGVFSSAAAEPSAGDAHQVIEFSDTTGAEQIVNARAHGVVLHPGVHTVNSDLAINGSGSHVLIKFNEDRECGQMEVNGKLTLGPDNPPALSLDMGNARFVRGDQFVIFKADEIDGKFASLVDGGTLQNGDVSLRIDYEDGSITLTVTGVPKHWHPRVTPAFEFDADVVYPTATAPGS